VLHDPPHHSVPETSTHTWSVPASWWPLLTRDRVAGRRRAEWPAPGPHGVGAERLVGLARVLGRDQVRMHDTGSYSRQGQQPRTKQRFSDSRVSNMNQGRTVPLWPGSAGSATSEGRRLGHIRGPPARPCPRSAGSARSGAVGSAMSGVRRLGTFEVRQVRRPRPCGAIRAVAQLTAPDPLCRVKSPCRSIFLTAATPAGWSRRPGDGARWFGRSDHRIRDTIVICLVCVNSRRFTHPRLEFHIRFVPCAIILGGRGYGRFA